MIHASTIPYPLVQSALSHATSIENVFSIVPGLKEKKVYGVSKVLTIFDLIKHVWRPKNNA